MGADVEHRCIKYRKNPLELSLLRAKMCCARVEVYALVIENVCAFDHFDSAGHELIVLLSSADVIATLPPSLTQTPTVPATKKVARYGERHG